MTKPCGSKANTCCRIPGVSATLSGGSPSPFFPNRREAGEGDTQVRKQGTTYISVGPLMEVRKCNAEMTSCAWGVAKVTSRMTLIDADKNSATVAVELVYDPEQYSRPHRRCDLLKKGRSAIWSDAACELQPRG